MLGVESEPARSVNDTSLLRTEELFRSIYCLQHIIPPTLRLFKFIIHFNFVMDTQITDAYINHQQETRKDAFPTTMFNLPQSLLMQLYRPAAIIESIFTYVITL